MLDPGENEFRTVPQRLQGELERRLKLAAQGLNYHHSLLDDFFRTILPHDLVLVGAGPGVGKTQLAWSIAVSSARAERRVRYFALEAEPDELERRLKYAMLVDEARRRQLPGAMHLDFVDWLLGNCEDVCGPLNAYVDQKMAAELETLHTLYRGRQFDADNLAEKVIEYADETDLFVIDHLHYVDGRDNEDENRAVADLIKTIRDLGLRVGKPFIIVAHLRKKEGDARAQRLVPILDDFHGSSNLGKVVTHAVVMERAEGIEAPAWYLSPTFFAMRKDRRQGASRLIGMIYFNSLTRTFADHYTLGRIKGNQWKELFPHEVPRWAKRHEPIEHVPGGHPNAPGSDTPPPAEPPDSSRKGKRQASLGLPEPRW